MTPGFPDDAALCENCGYRLNNLSPDQSCPECGAAIEASDPIHRPGLPWQRSLTPYTWLETIWGIIFMPRRRFRQLRIGGSNHRDRLFLLSMAVVVGLAWAGLWMMDHSTARPVRVGLFAGTGLILLSYIEALGVAYFSRRRGWRVPWPLSERVACYAAAGWVLPSLILAQLLIWQQRGLLWNVLPSNWGILSPFREQILLVLLAIGGMMWFEILIWLGVNQVRFGNATLKKASAS